MHFERFRARNFGPFEDLDVSLVRGAIGVFGPNGAGKSFFVNGLYACLTGDFGRFNGVKIDQIRNTAEENAESWLQADLTHCGIKMSIKRKLRWKPTAELVVDGKEVLTDSNKIQAKLVELLGADLASFDLYVFKQQDKIYDFLAATNTKRAETFAALCRTEKCGEIYDLLGDWLNHHSAELVDITDNSDELQQQFGELRAQHKELDGQLATEKAKFLNVASLDGANKVLRKWETLERTRKELAEADAQHDKSAAELVEAASLEHAAIEEAAGRQADVIALRPKAEAAKQALKAWAQHERQVARHNELLAAQQALTTQKAGLVEPVKPKATQAKVEDLRAEIVALNHQRDKASNLVAAFSKTGLIACPTCGTPVATLELELSQARQTLKTVPASLAKLRDIVQAIELYGERLRSYDRQLEVWQVKKQANDEALSKAQELETPEGDAKRLNNTLTDYECACGKCDDAAAKLLSCQTAAISLRADVKHAAEQQARLQETLAANQETPERAERAKQRLAEHAAAEKAAARLQGLQEGVAQQMTSLQAVLKKLRAKMQRSAVVKRMLGIVTRCRAVMHSTALPKRVATANLLRLEGSLNANIARFGNPFWVEADDSLSFLVHKPGEPAQPAMSLSTGQRIILALSFWEALATLWQADLGLLVLDEPTAHLDEDNRRCLGDALDTWRAKIRGCQQLIMVTHDQSLRGMFDQVIDFGA